MQQFFTSMQDYSHLVVECSTKTTLSDDKSHDFTAYLVQQQPHSKSFLYPLHINLLAPEFFI